MNHCYLSLSAHTGPPTDRPTGAVSGYRRLWGLGWMWLLCMMGSGEVDAQILPKTSPKPVYTRQATPHRKGTTRPGSPARRVVAKKDPVKPVLPPPVSQTAVADTTSVDKPAPQLAKSKAVADTVLPLPSYLAARRIPEKRAKDYRVPVDSLVTPRSFAIADSLRVRQDSAMYTRFKQRMYKHRATRELYDALFRDVYNSQVQTGEVNQIEVNPFQPFEGKVIGEIYIRRLSVFGQSVYDTLRQSDNWLEKFSNRLHTNTRENIIRKSYLLFRQGDAIDPNVLRDNERLLRSAGLFHDARILVMPRPGSRQFVDVYVITQDVWSLLPDGGFGGFNNFNVGFEQRNFRGLGHQLYSNIAYNSNDPVQRIEYRGRYTVPYIGKTFLTAQADVQFLRDYKLVSARVFRPFLTPDTKYAGSVQLASVWTNTRLVERNDQVQFIPLGYHLSDAWIGRSFKLFFGNPAVFGRSRLVVSARRTSVIYQTRPAVNADTNQLFQNSRTLLFSVGYSQRKYVRDVLIYGFGRTEDVPYGMLISLTAGHDQAELGDRTYAGLTVAQGRYWPHLGYLYAGISAGSFYRPSSGVEQGVFSLASNYFSPLHQTPWGNMRHFVNLGFTAGADRFSNEYVTLSGQNGIGIDADALRGTKRLLVSYENILFSKLSLVGFRVAFITFVSLGAVSFPERSLLAGPIYQGYGVGLRLRNENLTFNSFQFRLAWYPNVPDNPNALRFAVEGIPTARLRDFDFSAPEITPYR